MRGAIIFPMEASRELEAAILLWSKQRRVVRLRWALGSLEAYKRQLAHDLFNSHDLSQRAHFNRPRPYARDSQCECVQPLARSRDETLGSVPELLKPFDALQMRRYPVSSRINHVVNDDEECSRPVASLRRNAACSRIGRPTLTFIVTQENTSHRD
jgi:hypothetical protein